MSPARRRACGERAIITSRSGHPTIGQEQGRVGPSKSVKNLFTSTGPRGRFPTCADAVSQVTNHAEKTVAGNEKPLIGGGPKLATWAYGGGRAAKLKRAR